MRGLFRYRIDIGGFQYPGRFRYCSVDLNTNLSLGGPAQSTLRDALRAADSDATLRNRSSRGHCVSIDGGVTALLCRRPVSVQVPLSLQAW